MMPPHLPQVCFLPQGCPFLRLHEEAALWESRRFLVEKTKTTGYAQHHKLKQGNKKLPCNQNLQKHKLLKAILLIVLVFVGGILSTFLTRQFPFRKYVLLHFFL